jgi:hypothetical protein
LDIATAKTLDVDGFVMTVGGAVVTRDASGVLTMSLPNGEHRRISSEKCAGKVLHADAETEAIVFGCASAYAARRDMYVRTATGRKRLGFDLAPFELDSRFAGRPSWLALYPRNDTVLLHLATMTVYPAEVGTRVLATYGTHALAELDGHFRFLSLQDPDARKTKLIQRQLEDKRPPVTDILLLGRFAAIGAQLFDLHELKALGSFERPPLALSSDGYGLVPAASPEMRALSTGPLYWRRPRQ